MRRDLAFLVRQNTILEDQLKTLQRAELGGYASPPDAGARRLKRRIRELEPTDRRKARELLRTQEAQADVVNLQESSDTDTNISASYMRNLLRCFHNLMIAPAIDEDEECQVCMETMEVEKCRSLKCGHPICESCVDDIFPGMDGLACPQCRKWCQRDAIKVIQYTTSEQWDALVDLAREWAKIDAIAETSDSEEEAHEEIGEDERRARSKSSPLRFPSSSDIGRSSSERHVLEDLLTPQRKRRRRALTLDSSSKSDASFPQSPWGTPELAGVAAPGDSEGEITPIRLRKKRRIAITPESSSETVKSSAGLVAVSIEQDPMPQQSNTSDTRAITYSQSPRKEKKRRMQMLVAAQMRSVRS
ncbi:hypothetical protein AcW2_000092 [Taiwanofungus camphoratus]|nr:hypothetical protein AcW2_000092 [Antrodia cinnamomea]